MTLFRWLGNLFAPTPAASVAVPGIYRRVDSRKAKAAETSPQTTLFPAPTPLAPAATVEVVSPTTEADHYRWLDYTKPSPEGVDLPPQPSLPSVVTTEPLYNCSGSIFATGIMTARNWAVTGMSCISGCFFTTTRRDNSSTGPK